MLRKAVLFTFALIVASPAFAEDRYTTKKIGDGAWVVTDSTRTDGKSQTSGVFTTEDGAKSEAASQNKEQKKLDKKNKKAGIN